MRLERRSTVPRAGRYRPFSHRQTGQGDVSLPGGSLQAGSSGRSGSSYGRSPALARRTSIGAAVVVYPGWSHNGLVLISAKLAPIFSYAELERFWRVADELGFYGVWNDDHFYGPGAVGEAVAFVLDSQPRLPAAPRALPARPAAPPCPPSRGRCRRRRPAAAGSPPRSAACPRRRPLRPAPRRGRRPATRHPRPGSRRPWP